MKSTTFTSSLMLLLSSFAARFWKHSQQSRSPGFCSSEKSLMVLKHVWIWHVHSVSQQGCLCSCRIHEHMLNTAIKGHFSSSAKLTAPLSISTPCVGKSRHTIASFLFVFQLSEKGFLFNVWVSANLCYLLWCFLSSGAALFWWITIAFLFACLP